jgi:hypothetical protein
LRPQLLVGAIAATTIAIFTATPTPVIGGNEDLARLAVGASIILWLAAISDRNHREISAARAELADARSEVDRYREYTETDKLMRDAGQGTPPALPTPRGDIRPIPFVVDGETILVGVDESATLASVSEFRRALTDDDQAAQ